MDEFSFINKYFLRAMPSRKDVLIGIGDDAAVLQMPPAKQLVATIDTLISGKHFPIDALPRDIGYKALAVNLSDLAAMGATPAWAMLAITMPVIDELWCDEFCQGFFELLDKYHMQLIGGDTTRGHLSITVQVMGFVDCNRVLRRDGAKEGDLIYVTGTLGDAGVGLAYMEDKIRLPSEQAEYVKQRLNRPTPRIEIGRALLNIASSTIDISDGLIGDLGHILELSHVGATINLNDLPLSTILRDNLPREDIWRLALAAGDDYELCFTVPPTHQEKLEKILSTFDCPITHIGSIETEPGIRLLRPDGKPYTTKLKGYQHFESE